jgi:hypothetical protein
LEPFRQFCRCPEASHWVEPEEQKLVHPVTQRPPLQLLPVAQALVAQSKQPVLISLQVCRLPVLSHWVVPMVHWSVQRATQLPPLHTCDPEQGEATNW